MILGASFDAPEQAKGFAALNDLSFRLLCDVDRTVASAYQVVRPAGDQYEDFPLRITYLIDPEGIVGQSYAVADVRGHALQILGDLVHLQAARR